MIAIHDGQVARFGGLAGLKSGALVESAAAAPLNHFDYAGERDILRLAVVLANAIVRDHPFLDGNKRTATVAMLEFLYVNGLTLELPDTAAQQPLAAAIEELAAGTSEMAAIERWLRPHLRAV